jgi:tripartite-type tricarboxylate transporter receptor subunit TctC
VRAIAMTYQTPSPLVPGLVPVSDTLPGFELLGWYGLQVPLQTPKHIIAAINAGIVKTLRNPEIQEKLFAVGAEAVGSSPGEFDGFLRRETDRWEKVLRSGGAIPPAIGR